MLEEAIDVIRLLWSGGTQSFYGLYYTVENARIYTLPDQLPPILVAGAGSSSAELAGRMGDGFVSTAPKQDLVDAFEEAGGSGKPVYGQVHVCYHQSEAEARRMAYEIWPTAGVKGELGQELPTPAHFEQAAQMVTRKMWRRPLSVGRMSSAISTPSRNISTPVRSHLHSPDRPDQAGSSSSPSSISCPRSRRSGAPGCAVKLKGYEMPRTTPSQMPPMAPSDEADEKQLELARQQGEQYVKALQHMVTQVAGTGGEQRAGEYIVAYAIERPEGMYHLENGELMWQEPEGKNAHLEISVRDAADNRFIPGLSVHVRAIDSSGYDTGKHQVPFLWHPWLYHYGRNWTFPSSGVYTLEVEIDAPQFHRHDEKNGKRYADAVSVVFENVQVKID